MQNFGHCLRVIHTNNTNKKNLKAKLLSKAKVYLGPNLSANYLLHSKVDIWTLLWYGIAWRMRSDDDFSWELKLGASLSVVVLVKLLHLLQPHSEYTSSLWPTGHFKFKNKSTVNVWNIQWLFICQDKKKPQKTSSSGTIKKLKKKSKNINALSYQGITWSISGLFLYDILLKLFVRLCK